MDNKFEYEKAKRVAKSRGVKLVWLAEQIHCSKNTIYRYFSGETTPNKPTIESLARLLNCEYQDLVAA